MKKKLSALLLASAMMLGLAACGGGGASTPAPEGTTPAENTNPDATLTLRIGISTNEEDPRAIAAQQFADEIAEKTDGALTAQVYPSGQLGGDADLINSMALDSGTVDIIITDASNFATYDPKMGISAPALPVR